MALSRCERLEFGPKPENFYGSPELVPRPVSPGQPIDERSLPEKLYSQATKAKEKVTVTKQQDKVQVCDKEQQMHFFGFEDQHQDENEVQNERHHLHHGLEHGHERERELEHELEHGHEHGHEHEQDEHHHDHDHDHDHDQKVEESTERDEVPTSRILANSRGRNSAGNFFLERSEDSINFPGPELHINPFQVRLDYSDNKECWRSCAAVISGSVDLCTPRWSYVLVASLIDGPGSVEVHRMCLDSAIAKPQGHVEGGREVGHFRIKLSGLEIGGRQYKIELVAMRHGQVFRKGPSDVSIAPHISPSNPSWERSFSTFFLPPLQPRQVTCLKRYKRELDLCWKKPACLGGSQAVTFHVQIRRFRDSRYQEIYSGPNQSVHIGNLVPGTSYCFRICAANAECGIGPWCEEVLVDTEPDTPSTPGSPVLAGAVHSCGELALCWVRPSKENGSPLQYYELEMKPASEDGSFFPVYKGRTASCILTENLHPGGTYIVRVRAVNEVGPSHFSEEATVQLLGTAPCAPSPPLVTVEGRVVTIVWEAPTRENGSQTKLYALEICRCTRTKKNSRNEFSVVYNGSKSSVKLDTLSLGAKYRFRVLAQNCFGWSDPSEETSFRLPSLPPSPPGKPFVVNKYPLSIGWEEIDPLQKNGAALEQYVLYWKLVAQLLAKPPVKLGSIELSVKSDAAMDSGAASDVEIVNRPLVGESIDYFCESNGLWFTGKVTGTLVERDNRATCAVEFWGCTEPIQIPTCNLFSRLQEGDLCRAINYSNAHRLEPASVAKVTPMGYYVTFIGQYCVPQHTPIADIDRLATGDDVYPGEGSNEYLSNAVSSLSKINIALESDPLSSLFNSPGGWVQAYRGLENSVDLQTPIMPGFGYHFKTAAVNEAGEGQSSEVLIVERIVQRPRPPSRCARPKILATTDKSATLELRQPAFVFGEQLVAMEVSIAAADETKAAVVPESKVSTLTASASYTKATFNLKPAEARQSAPCKFEISLPRPGSPYVIRVRAVSKQGTGPWSQAIGFWTQFGLPDHPADPEMKMTGQKQVVLGWSTPSWDGGSPILGYRVRFAKKSKSQVSGEHQAHLDAHGTDVACPLSTSNISWRIEGELLPGSVIVAQLFAFNQYGESHGSRPVSFRIPKSPPSSPGNVNVTRVEQSSAFCTWEPPAFDGGEDILYYELDVIKISGKHISLSDEALVSMRHASQSSGHKHTTPSDVPEFHLRGLKAGSVYLLRVLAVNSSGSGPYSSRTVVRTERSAIEVPKGLRVKSSEPLEFAWEPVVADTEVSYRLQLSVSNQSGTASKTSYHFVYRGPATQYKISDVNRGATYRARVCAVRGDSSLTSRFSAPCTIKIKAKTPVVTKQEHVAKTKAHVEKSIKAKVPTPCVAMLRESGRSSITRHPVRARARTEQVKVAKQPSQNVVPKATRVKSTLRKYARETFAVLAMAVVIIITAWSRTPKVVQHRANVANFEELLKQK